MDGDLGKLWLHVFFLKTLVLVDDWSLGHGFAHCIPSVGPLMLDGRRLGKGLFGVFFLKTLVWRVSWTMGHGFSHCMPSLDLLRLVGCTLGQGCVWWFLSQDSGRDG